jgi:hypothetical protein
VLRELRAIRALLEEIRGHRREQAPTPTLAPTLAGYRLGQEAPPDAYQCWLALEFLEGRLTAVTDVFVPAAAFDLAKEIVSRRPHSL